MRERPIQVHIAGCLALLLSGAASAQAAMPVSLSAHRAIYDLSLKSRTSGSPVMSVSGRMVHEFTGTPCDGYAVSMRWIAQFGDAQGELVVDDIRFTSFEDSAGESYSFASVRRMNDSVINEVKAHAAEDGPNGMGEVRLSSPTDEAFSLPPETAFPTEHLKVILEHAMAGESLATMRVYDVSDDGKQVYQTLAVIGAEHQSRLPNIGLQTGDGDPANSMRAWRVTISYFEGSAAGDETPVYSQSFDLFENGIAADLVLDYGDFAVQGDLKTLELLGGDECDPATGG